ncbi:MAG TPA: hypothetical protein VKR32_19205 [Puia sp.]|nr:hypothetical protein [Puia sp.]
MKKIFVAIAGLTGIIMLSSFDNNAPINKKVLQSFHAEYGNPSNARWIAYPHDDYVVFTQNNILVRAEYDLRGNQLYALRYFDAKSLPSAIFDNLEAQFPGEKIDMVTEVSDPDGMAYVIQLEDKKSLTTVVSDLDGNIAVQHQMYKAG